MPNYGYHFARAEGRAVRAFYRRFLNRLPAIEPMNTFPLEVFSYSGEAALPEQVASIRSFLRHVGRPAHFTVVSDGSYWPAACSHYVAAKKCPGAVSRFRCLVFRGSKRPPRLRRNARRPRLLYGGLPVLRRRAASARSGGRKRSCKHRLPSPVSKAR